MRSLQQQLGIWEPSQHLLEDRGKPRKPVSRWPVAGPYLSSLTYAGFQLARKPSERIYRVSRGLTVVSNGHLK
jgi:hypothetical protein